MPTLFSVNVNKIALLRNARGIGSPDWGDYVSHIVGRGVKGITMHPRPFFEGLS